MNRRDREPLWLTVVMVAAALFLALLALGLGAGGACTGLLAVVGGSGGGRADRSALLTPALYALGMLAALGALIWLLLTWFRDKKDPRN